MKQDAPAATVYREIFIEMELRYEGHDCVYTDCSKYENGVGAAAVCGDVKKMKSLPGKATVYTTTKSFYAISMAVDIIELRRL